MAGWSVRLNTDYADRQRSPGASLLTFVAPGANGSAADFPIALPNTAILPAIPFDTVEAGPGTFVARVVAVTAVTPFSFPIFALGFRAWLVDVVAAAGRRAAIVEG